MRSSKPALSSNFNWDTNNGDSDNFLESIVVNGAFSNEIGKCVILGAVKFGTV